MAIEKTQFVTVPILDVRFAAVDVRFAAVEARFAAIHARFDAVEAQFAKVDARFDRMEAKMERWAVRMLIAMLVSQTALGPIGMGALDAVRRVLSTLVHWSSPWTGTTPPA